MGDTDDLPWKSIAAYDSGEGVCYITETGTAYTKADFLRLVTGDEQKARILFRACSWQHPETLLDEEERDHCLFGEDDAFLPFFTLSDHSVFGEWLSSAAVVEFHSDGKEEPRSDVQLLYSPINPYYVILRDGVVFCVMSRCPKDDADFCLQGGEKALYVCYYSQEDELVEFGSRQEAFACLRQLSV